MVLSYNQEDGLKNKHDHVGLHLQKKKKPRYFKQTSSAERVFAGCHYISLLLLLYGQPTMADIIMHMLLTEVLWEVIDGFLKIPGPWRFC